MFGIIYCLTSPEGKSYVGQTTKTVAERLSTIMSANGPRLLRDAIKRYGRDSFHIEELEWAPEGALNRIEREWIAKLNTVAPYGYNLITGGVSEMTNEHAGSTNLCPDGHCDDPCCYCNRGRSVVGALALRAAEDLAVREQSADWDRDDARDEQMESLGEYPMFHEEN